MIYEITPVPKPRQTRSDKWKQRDCVMRYRAFADQVRAMKITVDPGDEICFYLPMPKSWGIRKKAAMSHKPHTQTPDLDNLIKSLLDAIYGNDSHIWCLGRTEKRWAYEGSILIVKPKLGNIQL